MKCPGQDTRFWKPEDIFNVPCPACNKPVEFFKDDSSRKCSNCGYRFKNPRLDLGCAEYCPYGDQCLAEIGAVPSKGNVEEGSEEGD
jgi:hypothetical protein